MKWFKHDSNACMDSKLIQLKDRYGLEGYGLYWYCLEIISAEEDQSTFTFELDHDAEIISQDIGVPVSQIKEIMEFIVNLGLFENSIGMINCLTVVRRLEQAGR